MAVAGEGRLARGIAVHPLGIGEGVGGADEQRAGVVDRARGARILPGVLRVPRIGEREVRRREAVEVEVAFGPAAAGEDFEAGREVEPALPAGGPLLEPVGFGAVRGLRETVGAVVAGRGAEEAAV